MLNISEEMSNFKAIDLENVESKIGKIPEDMKNAIELYNKALEDINNKNEDIAIIALKKAIAIYPAFYEAMNLMGVCFSSLDDEQNARRMFTKVIQMDDNSIRASHYIDQLDGKVSGDETKSKSSWFRDKSRSNPPMVAWIGNGLSAEKNNPYFLKYVLGFILGVLVICFVWIMVPVDKPIIFDFGKLFTKPVNESGQINGLKSENIELTTRLTEAMDALKAAQATEKQLQDQMDQYVRWSGILRDLQNLAEDGKYKEVVIEIEKQLAGLSLPEDIEKEIIALNNTCKPKAINQFYESAWALYNSNSKTKSLDVYKQSANEYLMAIRIIEELQEKPTYINEIYYYGGKAIALSQSPSAEEANTEAIRCFRAVIATSPNSKLASYSQARINEIQGGKTIRH
jgi:tetratricopeptide (TPR) repeat protein